MPGAQPRPALSVVIPTLGRSRALAETLGRLDRQRRAPSFEVLVCLDCEEIDHRLLPGSPGYRLRVIERQGEGASAARNAGWERAESDLILFLGDDILAEPELVSAHAAAHREAPEPTSGVLGHVRWADSLRRTALMAWLERGIQFDYDAIAGHSAGWGRFYTANASLKRDLLESHDGFDQQRFPFLYEDLELAYRLHRSAGFELIYEPGARAEHLHPPTLADWKRRIRAVATAERRLTEVHPELEPQLRQRFAAAASKPAARGRGRVLTPHIPPGLPWLGPRAHNSADLWFRQQLAADFEHGWAAAGPGG